MAFTLVKIGMVQAAETQTWVRMFMPLQMVA